MPDDLPILAARLRRMQREMIRRHLEAEALHAEPEHLHDEPTRLEEHRTSPWAGDARPPEPGAPR